MARFGVRPAAKILSPGEEWAQGPGSRKGGMDGRPPNSRKAMENPNSFDLNVAIGQWRESLARLPGFKSHNLRELEVHLRDSVASLQAHNLTPEESFIVACHRLGTPDGLAVEFSKVNRNTVWLERAMWMLAGTQFFVLVTGLARVTSSLALLLGLRFSLGPGTLAVLSVVMYTLAFATVMFVAWRLMRQPPAKVRRILARLFRYSSLTAIVIIFAGVLLTLLGSLPTLLLVYWNGIETLQTHIA